MAGDTPCLIYRGTTNSDGYGILSRPHNGSRLAHRKALSEALGRPVVVGLFALHRCDNPPCIAGDHLYEGTQADNMADKVRRGRASGRFRDVESCVNGHDFTPENTVLYVSPRGRRERKCVTCRRTRNAQTTARRKAVRHEKMEARCGG